jgi:tetratricopeptide (TPR) repeat protein
MKKSIFILLFSFVSLAFLHAGENTALVEQGNKYYAEGKYTEAITAYEKTVNEGLVSPELFFNLGNAYYKNGKLAEAILYYEKAKKLSPHDEDILFNLNHANSKITDKVDALPTLFIHEWKNSFFSSFTETGWSILCICTFLLFSISLGTYIISKKVLLKQIGFWGTIIFFAGSLSFYFIAKKTFTDSVEARDAIVLSSSETVKGSPNEKGTRLFVLHEGTKVRVEGSENNWIEIKLANGNVGWVPSSSLGII